MIVQALHDIQQRFHYLPADELQALSKRLGVPLHRIHEVASFYPLYRLHPPAQVEVKVCRDMACHLRGADQLLRRPGRSGKRNRRLAAPRRCRRRLLSWPVRLRPGRVD